MPRLPPCQRPPKLGLSDHGLSQRAFQYSAKPETGFGRGNFAVIFLNSCSRSYLKFDGKQLCVGRAIRHLGLFE
jgi:hypothetical protein